MLKKVWFMFVLCSILMVSGCCKQSIRIKKNEKNRKILKKAELTSKIGFVGQKFFILCE